MKPITQLNLLVTYQQQLNDIYEQIVKIDETNDICVCDMTTYNNYAGKLRRNNIHIYIGIESLAKAADQELTYNESNNEYCFEYHGIIFFQIGKSEDK